MKLITWNMQGASHSTENKWNEGVMNFFGSRNADICCLQECGGVPASAQLVNANFGGIINLQYYTWGTLRSQKHILFYLSDPNGNRCNIAVVAKFAPLGASLVYPAVAPVWRPALGFQIDAVNFAFSFHAISPNGPDAANMLNAINAAVGNNWVTAGDYNREPQTLVTPYTICPPNNNTYSSTNPTRAIDYCVNNSNNVIEGTVLGLYLSDHFSVEYTF